jgi:hypothetical protein
VPRQLARKWMFDREHFDLEAFNAVFIGTVRWTEVVIYICRELDR